MKLYTLEPSGKLAANISGISKRTKMNVLIENVDTLDLDTLVVIGDGTPDDIAFSIIAFHLKVDKIAWIVKEDDKMSTIYERIQKSLKKLAKCEIKIIDEESEKRLKVYEFKYGSKEFELILVINGLDEIHTDKHSIEDHLLKAAELLSIEIGDFENSKEAWNSIKDRHEDIFKKLKKKRKIVESVFPQQIQGCKYLAEKL
ncbi:MAG: hypothetical protein H8D26_03035 [Methanomicrobia archaeon]|nr:hypothetical protein [Methanomicrobia archaeon]